MIPDEYDINTGNELVVNSVIAWSFYPKLLTREGKGWRNVANNQAVSLHPTSVNKQADSTVKWLSYYHIMQSRSRAYNAHETSAVEDFAIALLCGDPDFKVCPRNNRIRDTCTQHTTISDMQDRCTRASSPSIRTGFDSQSAIGKPCWP